MLQRLFLPGVNAASVVNGEGVVAAKAQARR